METMDLRCYETVKTRMRSRLLSSEWHKIDDLVKRNIAGDVWLTFYVDIGEATWSVTYDLLEEWQVDMDTLEADAKENAKGTASIQRMRDVLQLYLDTPPWEDPADLYVITRNGAYGADALLDPEIQQKIDAMFPEGAFILMSSVHEMLCLSVSTIDPNHLCEMVRTINRSDVMQEGDVLSDHVYRYDHGKLTVEI